MKIMINPGHCPIFDSGACGFGMTEADTVLAIGAYRSYNTSTKKYGTSNFAYISVTDFKASLLSPVYQKISVPGNMLIRHNGANCYVPLTTDKSLTSTPCLAVRHGNTNYYAIK